MSSITTTRSIQESRRGEIMIRLFLDLQVARFNELYYQRRSASLRLWAKCANMLAAISAITVLASLLKDGFGLGPLLWQCLTGLAAVSAAIGPIVGLETKAIRLEQAALGYGIVRDRIRRLLNDLKLSGLEPAHEARDKEIDGLRLALAALDEPPSNRMRRKCWDQTLQEFPSDQAWTLV